jgi:hypothetical protein
MFGLLQVNEVLNISDKEQETINFILILIPCILEYVESNQQNALNSYLFIFLFTIAATCFGKTMPSSGRNYVPF